MCIPLRLRCYDMGVNHTYVDKIIMGGLSFIIAIK